MLKVEGVSNNMARECICITSLVEISPGIQGLKLIYLHTHTHFIFVFID